MIFENRRLCQVRLGTNRATIYRSGIGVQCIIKYITFSNETANPVDVYMAHGLSIMYNVPFVINTFNDLSCHIVVRDDYSEFDAWCDTANALVLTCYGAEITNA